MKLKCNRCKKEVDVILSPRFVELKHPLQKTDKRIPKWNVMVKAMCSECRIYIKFVEQTESTMRELESLFVN